MSVLFANVDVKVSHAQYMQILYTCTLWNMHVCLQHWELNIFMTTEHIERTCPKKQFNASKNDF